MKSGDHSVPGYSICKGPEANAGGEQGEMALAVPEEVGRGQILQEL